MLPIIIRELRMQARQPLTYWLRMVGALSVSAAVGMALWKMVLSSEKVVWMMGQPSHTATNEMQSFGIALFGKINLFIFAAIWIFVPLSTADAISRERREGTLPLLYLTPLRSR